MAKMMAKKPGKKMTMAEYEKSPADKAMDKSGKHGGEGSKKDMKFDKALLAKMNKGKK